MLGEPKQFSLGDVRSWERVIAVVVLDAGADGRSEVEVLDEVRCERPVFEAAIGRLSAEDVLVKTAGTLRAACARHLDELRLIAI